MSNGHTNAKGHEPSKSAMGVAFLRAAAVLDERHEIRGQDTFAELFLIDQLRAALQTPAARDAVTQKFFFPGAYEYILARTAFVDQVVEQTLKENIPQIVFLGAGYDSRPYRFRDLAKDTVIFELDVASTQESKRQLLRNAGVTVPSRVVFVPIDFNTESLETALLGAGYLSGRRTLFVWEGVTMYLTDEAVNDTLGFIRAHSLRGSLAFFDYHALWSEMSGAYGVAELRQFHEANASGEQLRFGIERDQIGGFLSERGYSVAEHLTAAEIEKRYLTLKDGSRAGTIPALICFALASVV